MGFIRDYEYNAIQHIYNQAKLNESDKISLISKICGDLSIDNNSLIKKLLSSHVTINFQPDRFSNNGKIIIENLINEGVYLSQFKTGTTNGGQTAYSGGDRFLWEQWLFSGIYPEKILDRPKYGALNIFEYLDGASPRFGSCYFTLKHDSLTQCTFAFGDSSTNPDTLCTVDSFYGILAAILLDVQQNGRMLNQENYSVSKAINCILSIGNNSKNSIGRNLDYCVETHIHGDIELNNDIECLYMDESFKGSMIDDYAEILVEKFNIKLHWIPIRQIAVTNIDGEFRGPMIRPLAQKIDLLLGNSSGIINASLIGTASRSSFLNPSEWEDIGDKNQVFQYLKQLWHTTAYFG